MIYLVDGPIQSARQDVADVVLKNAAIIFDFASDDRVVAIEILGASRVLPTGLTAWYDWDVLGELHDHCPKPRKPPTLPEPQHFSKVDLADSNP